MGPLGYRTQADHDPLIIRLPGDEYCPQLEQDLHQVFILKLLFLQCAIGLFI